MKLCTKFEPFFKILYPEYDEEFKDIRYVVLIGGRGGAKSYALSTWINSATYNKGWGILTTRYTMSSAEKSIIPEFINICEILGNEGDFTPKKTQVINDSTGVVIDYSGLKPTSLNSTGALKSVANKNVFVLEEAEDCPSFELFDKVDNSIRTINQKNIVILCLNQGHINHWIFKEFINEDRDDVMLIETTYLDNIEFLDESFIKKAERVKARDLRRYNHVYLNEWKRDVDGALWMDSDISPYRITLDEYNKKKLNGDIKSIIIAYDPAVTDSDKSTMEKMNKTGNEPDEDGITVQAKCKDNHYYILKDKTMRGKRSDIAQKIVNLYHMHDAEEVIIEKNNGGDFIPALIKTADNGKYVRCRTVSATKGKYRRAAPIQALYENGEVHHVGHFPELELEMTTWIDDVGVPSPNRMDSLVWGLTGLSGGNSEFFIV